ncbi:MAG TPA: preprotein translocase subunit SecE [Alphaproteobacteria bacterium]|nr:preprotein translocase subunit SecE [Alphaproteobacteria bacterium]
MNKVVEFFSEVKKETAKVTWPTRKETILTSVMVVVLSTVMAVFFLGVDSILAYVMRFIINLRI